MNVPTAIGDRREPRDRPHTPWPLVQPFASVVPTPTSTPAIASRGTPRTGAPIASGATSAANQPDRDQPGEERDPEPAATIAVERAPERAADPGDPACVTSATDTASPISAPPPSALAIEVEFMSSNITDAVPDRDGARR